MNQTANHSVVHMTIWISLSILLPLSPIGLGILIATLRQVEIDLTGLLDGIEVLLISLGLVTATGIDLSQARPDWSSRTVLYFLIRFFLILLGIVNVILLTLIYVNDRVSNLEFDLDTKFTFVLFSVLSISVFTIALQLNIGYARYRRSMEETAQ